MNVNRINIPLIRVDHPSKAECDQEVQNVARNIRRENTNFIQNEDDQPLVIDKKQERAAKHPGESFQYTPNFFNFEHPFDRELVPVREWQKKVNDIANQLDFEKQKNKEFQMQSIKERQDLEKTIAQLNTDLTMARQTCQSLEQQIGQEQQLKEDYNKNAKEADFKLNKERERFQVERERMQQEKEHVVKREDKQLEKIELLRDELQLKQDEIQRLKDTIVNKDAENNSLEQMLQQEKQRREGENGEIRNMLYQEQTKSIDAALEAKELATKIQNYIEKANNAEEQLQRKTAQLEALQEKFFNKQHEKNTDDDYYRTIFENKQRNLEELHSSRIAQMDQKLAKKDIELEKREQLILRLNHQIDQVNSSREEIKIELDSCKIEKIRLEEQINYNNTQHLQLQEKLNEIQEEFDEKIKSKQMELWKQEMTQKQLIDKMIRMQQEMDRLQKVKDLGESVARLPDVCLQDLQTGEDMKTAKNSALHQAVNEVRGEDYDQLVSEIDQIHEKSKKAYVRLYEKVGEDIGMHFLDKLDYMKKQEGEADKLLSSHKYSSAQHELQRLQDEKHRIAKMQKQKDREYLKSEPAPNGDLSHKTNIADLFRKYNI